MNNVHTLVYDEDFSIDLSSRDALDCDGVSVENNRLLSLNDYVAADERTDYLGLAGASAKYVFAHSNKSLRRYDGETVKNLFGRVPASNVGAETCHDVYRGKAYFAFEQDGVIVHDENKTTAAHSTRWAPNDDAMDVAVVNERLVMLLRDGVSLHFSEVGKMLLSEGLVPDYVVAEVTLPSAVQAICRSDNNTLYALGDTVYKIKFSADEQDITVTAVAHGLGEVVRRSVANLGGKIIFAARHGLYALHGDAVTPVFTELGCAVGDFYGARASVWRGRYVLTVPYLDGRRGYALNVDKSRCDAILARDVLDIATLGGVDVAATVQGSLARSADTFRLGTFTRSHIDFGTSKRKYLRALNVVTKSAVEISISCDGGEKRVYRLNGSDKMQKLYLFGSGREFTLQLQSASSEQMEVSKLTICAEAYKEEYYGNI